MDDLKDNLTISDTDTGTDLKAVSAKPGVGTVILLNAAIPGKKYIVQRIVGGHGISGRLNAMGILPKEVITVIFQTWGGPLTIAVKGVRIALGRGITHKIEVSEANA